MSREVISSWTTGICDGCGKVKKIRLYNCQDGETRWICVKCRGSKD